ncbi:FAD-dependent oxidoreductase [Glutamicibacter arilaitensis]|uniref:FAD-dependent oxidoreductase n=1 Tax=Glutamicibacter arilaitensis TaxID=256701 RepID=UPI0018670517|nr:FAD-dependent oxidoreductase [Glutamicibacter arilaitensis]
MNEQRPQRIAIIGFGPVAASLIEGLLPAAAAGHCEITVISAENHLAYNRVLLAELAAGAAEFEHLSMVDPQRLADAGVQVRLGVQATGIDRSRRRIHLGGNDYVSYDRLVFATGARTVIPTLNGLNFDPHADASLPAGVFALRTVDDAHQLRKSIELGQRILILGGGVLGIEAALAIARTGAQAVLVHHGPAPLGRVVDADGGALLSRNLREAGVEVIPGAKASGIQKDAQGFTGLMTSTHGLIQADALLISTGVRARTELASGCGLPVGRGIKTDAFLCADTEQRIFALGDCAEVAGQPPVGLLAPGWAQAAWLSQQLLQLTGSGASEPLAAPDFSASNVLMLKGQGIELTAAGDISAGYWDDTDLQATIYADPARGRYLKIVTRQDAVTGFLAMGLPQTSAELVLAYERATALPEDRSSLLRLDDPATEQISAIPSDEDQLCRCSGATYGEVAHAVGAGCATVAQVGENCRAGTGCGGCKSKIEELLAKAPALA